MMYLVLQHFVFGMISAILFSTIACFFGIPTSESHGLIAGISGAAIALCGINSININKWVSVMLGLTWSIVGGIIITKIVYKCISKVIYKINVNKIKKSQILACLVMSFAHGAQDGLKFIGIFHMYTKLVSNNVSLNNDFLIVLICALTMAFRSIYWGKKNSFYCWRKNG